MAETAEGRLGRRLRRILLLLPYAIQHPGVSVDELATKFGVRKKDLVDDLNLVFMCGLPGYGPGDLIDATIDDDRVYVRMADYFSAPLRLTPAEALALYAGGQALVDLPDMEEADSLQRALAKLGRALGAGVQEDDVPSLSVKLEGGPSSHLATVQRGVASGTKLELDYLSGTRGELTTRTIQPWGLVAAVGRWYLVAWDQLTEDERMFRLDRIKRAELKDETFDPPAEFDAAKYRSAFVEGAGEQTVSFEISPAAARWFADYYHPKSVEDLDDGWQRIEIAAGGDRWPALLVLRLGTDVRKVAPASVQNAARRLAGAIARRNGCAA